LTNYISLLRIKDWLKNVVIIFPLLFSGFILEIEPLDLQKLLIYFVSFCLLTSVVYIFNDIRDLEEDKLNPSKQRRPLASGVLRKNDAYYSVIILTLIILSNVFIFNLDLFHYFLFYFLNNLLYNFVFKKIYLINSLSISLGFLIRLYLGSEIVNISLEPWLIILVFFGSFLLSVIKKYSDKVTDIGNLKIKHDILVINTTIFLISIIYVMHLVDVSVFNLFNSVISTIFFLLSLVLLRLGVKEINKSVDTIYILINDYRFVVSLIIWFVHYYFYRYF